MQYWVRIPAVRKMVIMHQWIWHFCISVCSWQLTKSAEVNKSCQEDLIRLDKTRAWSNKFWSNHCTPKWKVAKPYKWKQWKDNISNSCTLKPQLWKQLQNLRISYYWYYWHVLIIGLRMSLNYILVYSSNKT